ncbi:MAG TPA: hypothetical protein VK686_03945, partial [Bryobacteraceae bacterium]|nr:hypothetical protein [Bryobacteraceae bacterium]
LLSLGFGMALMFLAACAMPLAGSPRLRLALGVLIFFLCGMTSYKYVQAHYLAPVVGPFFVVAMFGVRLLRCHRLGGQRVGRALVASVLGLAGVLFMLDNAVIIYSHALHADLSAPAINFRRQVITRLGSEPGTHLVLVHYAASHITHEEIVYNTPDIDAQKIVWAFDFGPEADRPLLDYYRGRKVWLVMPDGPHPTLEPYSPNGKGVTANAIRAQSSRASS